jgi:hypothetical protein
MTMANSSSIHAPWRKSGPFLWTLGLSLLLCVLTFVHAAVATRTASPGLSARRNLVARLDLTDLALFTEARYTRHPSQADLHGAFQDHPLALEHFPTGSLVPAPAGSGWPAALEPSESVLREPEWPAPAAAPGATGQGERS